MGHPAGYTKEEWEQVPDNFVHLRRDGEVIHKDPAAFKERKRTVFVVNPKTGELEEKQKLTPPVASLKQYKKDGWEECQKDGSDLPEAKPGPGRPPKEKNDET